ncbi:MAG TPA: HNH endonuclease [Propionibacteriaceae bacterium]|nr:HNH endonuclease [Propionibacteriaceae bacterium]
MSELPTGAAERFWAKVALAGWDECWPWQAARDPNSYGRFGVDGSKTRLAHHVALWLHTGVDPRGSVVRHSCDNPPCVNPYHLTAGTHAENVADKVARGRQAGQRRAGAANGRTKVSDEGASAVLCLLENGFSVSACARIFGTSVNPILAIRNGTRPTTEITEWKAASA